VSIFFRVDAACITDAWMPMPDSDFEATNARNARGPELESEVTALRRLLAERTAQYQAEKTARASVERQLQRALQRELQTDSGVFVRPIGHVESCFTHVVGTPRQGALAPSTRACIRFLPSISPTTFDGLEGFGHVWLTVLFHLNTDIKLTAAQRSTHTAKVTLPLLQTKVGIFATRSPHRPNPVGFTLARLTGVDPTAKTLSVEGIDLVDGTPVLDVKPYIPLYDNVPPDALRLPDWLERAASSAPRRVVFTDTALLQLRALMPFQRHYHDSFEAMRRAITETLAVDLRSARQQQYVARRANRCRQPFDQAMVEFDLEPPSAAAPSGTALVIAITPLPATPEGEGLDPDSAGTALVTGLAPRPATPDVDGFHPDTASTVIVTATIPKTPPPDVDVLDPDSHATHCCLERDQVAPLILHDCDARA